MILPLLRYGDPRLRTKVEPVVAITDEIRTLIFDLEETMRAFNGIGIAAPQVGRLVAVFLIAPPHVAPDGTMTATTPRAFINPKLSNPSREVWAYSEANPVLPHISGAVLRPRSITVTAQDPTGAWFTETFHDLPARIVMHENDHLNGVLFIDRLSPQEKKKLEPKLKSISSKT